MQLMIEEICQHIRNWFCSYGNGDIYSGAFSIIDGEVKGKGITATPAIEKGNYYRIIGSRNNDGVYIAGTDIPSNEEFYGQVWILHPTASFLALVAEITAWQAENGAADSVNMSPFASESFGGYSYSKGGGSGSGGGTAVSWQSQFASRLNAWRKI